MSATQIKAAEILLKKAIPDLKSVELSGPDGGPLEHSISGMGPIYGLHLTPET
jgi:hypothetical protein